MEIEITALGSSGEGVGSFEGLKVFVEGALPGERVTARPQVTKKNYAIAKLEKILRPSPDRTPPICSVFGKCGGCQLMHLSYSGQLEAKRRRVRDALERIGGLECPVAPCIPSPSAFGYRNKIQLPLIWEGRTKQVGLFRKQSHELIPIDKCHIQCPEGEALLADLLPLIDDPSIRYLLIRNGLRTSEHLVILVSSHAKHRELAAKILEKVPAVSGVVVNVNTHRDNVILGSTFITLAGVPFIHERLGGKLFRFSAPSFFQVNPFQAEILYEKALELAGCTPNHTVLDAYCGVGALALLAAEKARSVIGIECVPHAIQDARENACLNRIENCRFICGKAEEHFERADIVFLNPPRKGCAPTLIDALVASKPKVLVYISCDPATLGRDAARLTAGGYSATEALPFDMFPQTAHVETVMRLTLQSR